MNIKLLFLLLMVFNLNCIVKHSEVPLDFYIRIGELPSHPQPGMSAYSLEIRHKTNSTDTKLFEMIEFDGNQTHLTALNYPDVLKLYQEVLDKKIMKMNDRYADMNMLDGGTTDLQLKMNGKEKRILLRNTSPPRLDGFFALIKKLKRIP